MRGPSQGPQSQWHWLWAVWQWQLQWQWQWQGHEDGTIDWPNVIDTIQTLLALVSSVVWLVGEYWTNNDEPGLLRAQFSLTIIYAAALVAQFASSGIRKYRQVWLAFDAVTCLPIFYQAYQLGYYSGDSGGWNGFITALQVPLQWLVVARFLRMVRLFRRTTLRSGALVISSDVVRSVTSLLFTVFCFIIVGGGLLQLIENSSTAGTQPDTWDALYTTFGVITVIGWGDSPTTTLGQVLVTFILLVALIILPLRINELVNSVSDHYKLGLPYTSRAPHVVMVVYPTMTPSDLSSMLREFYSYHAGLSVYHCVLLGSGGESHRRTLLRYIAKSKYWSSVSYVVGSPSSLSALRKVAVQHASAVFLLTSAWFVDPGQELADDEQTLFQAISIKQYCPAVPLILSLNKPRSRAHVMWYELCKFPNVQAVCLNEVKLQLLATQAMVEGLLGLIANLLQFGGRFDTESSFSWWRHGLRSHSHRNPFTIHELLATPLVLGAWPLSAAVPSDKPVDRAIQRSWELQYLTGFLQELRSCPLPQSLSGLCFADVAAALYERLLVVLLAVGRPDLHTGELRVMLNPGYGEQLRVEHGDLLCIMVQSEEHARAVTKVQWQCETVRERWLRCKHDGVSSQHVHFTSFGSPIHSAVPMSSIVARYYTAVNKPTPKQQSPLYSGQYAATMGDGLVTASEVPVVTRDSHAVNLPLVSDETETEMKHAAAPPSTTQPPRDEPVKRASGTDALSGHVVLCGFIDSRIVSFIRRFRASDSRPLVLMLDTAVCHPMPAVVERFISANFDDVHFIYAAHTFKARHQRARVFLSYSDPCFGHQHIGRSERDTTKLTEHSASALASCVSSRGGKVESERQRLTRPALPIDEVGPHDAKIVDSLNLQRVQEASGRETEGSEREQPRLHLTPPRYCRLDDDDSEPDVMDGQAVLQYANWYRRAAVHSADMVFVLASAYIAPPDSTSSNGGTALDDDIAVNREQLYIASLFQSSNDSPTDAVNDDQIRADQHAIIVYAGIQTYLRQCRISGGCSMLSGTARSPPVVVELLYNVNVRMLKQGESGITAWQPHVPRPVGWRWLFQCCLMTDSRSGPVQHVLAGEGDASRIPSEQPSDRRKALYSSDGLTLSSRLLDSLIVQAYVDPLVYSTVSALGTTYTHSIPAVDWQHMMPPMSSHTANTASDSGTDDEDNRAKRSFRVELMLLDMPEPLVGRSFGFMQLLMMVERGWVAMGLYRDKRTIMAVAAVHGNPSTQSEQSHFFVFTNPPPDICLQRTDRIYTLVQRWLDVSTAEAVWGQSSVSQPTTAPDTTRSNSSLRVTPLPFTASVPSSYSPRRVYPKPTADVSS